MKDNSKKSKGSYTNQDCGNYCNYMMNSNYGIDSNEDDLNELSRLGTEYAQELAFNNQIKKNAQRSFNDLETRREKYTNKKHTGSKINKQK